MLAPRPWAPKRLGDNTQLARLPCPFGILLDGDQNARQLTVTRYQMKILLAIDQSASGEQVLAEVDQRPWPVGASIRVVHALELAHSPMFTEVAEALEKNAKRVLERATERLRARGLAAEGIVLRGEPKAAILEQASTWPADLIIVGAHGASAVERFLIGSVSLGLLRHAPCSVEVVRVSIRRNAQEYTARYNEKYKVLLAVDGSKGSALAAEAVAGLPWPAWTEIRILSALELQLSFFRSAFEIPALDPTHLQSEREQAMLRAQQAVGEAREIVEPTGLKISESISVLLEPPKQIIVEEATEWNANLIVLGSHGLRGLDRFLLGSTSEAVATHAQCPVYVVREKKL
jgi:nucleotide-binding universal stress UspA family protein